MTQDSVSPAKRVVFYTNEGFFDVSTNQYVVARITENERGYDVYTKHATIEEARLAAETANQTHGLAVEDVLTVVASSMRITHSDARYEFNVTFTIDAVYAPDHETAAHQVADMLGDDYAQRAVYSVTQIGDPWAVNVDLSGEERDDNG